MRGETHLVQRKRGTRRVGELCGLFHMLKKGKTLSLLKGENQETRHGKRRKKEPERKQTVAESLDLDKTRSRDRRRTLLELGKTKTGRKFDCRYCRRSPKLCEPTANRKPSYKEH